MNKRITLIWLLVAPCFFQFCQKKEKSITGNTEITPHLPASPDQYVVTYPAHVQQALTLTDNTPSDNPITNDGATLGRVLFYDNQLSLNRKVNCGSCHQQQASFDDNAALSRGFDGGLTSRNSMAILNLRFYKSGKMFWDERSATLEAQALQPIQNHVEMNLNLQQLVDRVQAQSYYPALFEKAFGSPHIDTIRIAKALAQFERSIVTYQAKYDRVKQGLEVFTPDEARGEQLFLTAGGANTCASCHNPPMFLTSTPRAPYTFPDPSDPGINNQNRFKSGSLRNISSRTSLFHNGKVANLQAMFSAGAPGSGTQPIPAHSVPPQDAQSLIAFLNTLTDNSITTDPKFSDPFKR